MPSGIAQIAADREGSVVTGVVSGGYVALVAGVVVSVTVVVVTAAVVSTGSVMFG
jgi:hypothetical protein